MTSLPITLVILVLAFGALVAAGVPLLLGFTAVLAALGLTDLFSHLLHVYSGISSVILLIGLAVGIDYSLFYLRRVRQERARGPHARGGASGGGGDVRAGGADLRPHRDDRDDGDVPDGLPGLHVVRDRDRVGGRDRAGRLADRAAGRALQARRPGRPGAGAGPEPAPRQARRVAVLGERSSAWYCAGRSSGAEPPRRCWSRSRSPHSACTRSTGVPRRCRATSRS